jgi:hypothetical protein
VNQKLIVHNTLDCFLFYCRGQGSLHIEGDLSSKLSSGKVTSGKYPFERFSTFRMAFDNPLGGGRDNLYFFCAYTIGTTERVIGRCKFSEIFCFFQYFHPNKTLLTNTAGEYFQSLQGRFLDRSSPFMDYSKFL